MALRKLRWKLLACGVVVGSAAAGCSTLLSADPTPVPGAAATLTRSVRTPIPTPLRTPDAPGSPGSPSAVPSRAAAGGPSPSPAGASQAAAANEAELAQVQRRIEQALASPDLSGVENLLLDHVSLSTAQGGSVMDNVQAATWLRDHAGPGIKVSGTQRDTQTPMLQVLTDGWPVRDPIQHSHVAFSLRRYDPQGRPNEDVGEWKIDVIEAD